MLDREMSAAWQEASAHLSVRVVAPYSLQLPDGMTVEVEAFLPDFGGPHGAIAVALADDDRGRLVASAKQFGSRLAATYRTFDRDRFRDTLDDWGWYGSAGDRPEWYTGKAWT